MEQGYKNDSVATTGDMQASQSHQKFASVCVVDPFRSPHHICVAYVVLMLPLQQLWPVMATGGMHIYQQLTLPRQQQLSGENSSTRS
jgi:hypothetical protein